MYVNRNKNLDEVEIRDGNDLMDLPLSNFDNQRTQAWNLLVAAPYVNRKTNRSRISWAKEAIL